MSTHVSGSELREFFKQSWVQTTVALTFDWAVIIGAAVTAECIGGILAYLAAIPLIGARQHALYAVTHEAVHGGLAKSRRINDLIGELIAWMFLLDFHTYQRSHLAHHKYLNTMQDPDWARYNAPESPLAKEYKFPVSPSRLSYLLLGDLLGLRMFQLLAVVKRYAATQGTASGGEKRRRGNPYLMVTFYAGLIAAIYAIGWKIFLLYWVIPIFTWAKMNLRLRLMAEHYAVFGRDGTRTVEVNWLERFFLWPHFTAFHAHHHSYPGVRFFKLPELARRLGDDWYKEAGVARTKGLFGLFRELTATRSTALSLSSSAEMKT